MSKRESYPEHEKLSAVKDQSQRIGEFLEWLMDEKKVELAFWHKHSEQCDGFNADTGEIEPEYECGNKKHDSGEMKHDFGMYGCHPKRSFGCDMPCQTLSPFRATKEKLLAEFFEIDLEKLENEKRAMLDSLRAKA